LQARPT